jgi:SAM-dependent methyltransferase
MIRFGEFPSSPELTRMQRMFVEWNAERLQITYADSLERYLASWRLLPQGHCGIDYREFCVLSQAIFKVFHDDNYLEVYDAYKFHAPLHMLRFLSYNKQNRFEDAVLKQLRKRDFIAILDYGCGLAHESFSLAERLKERGGRVKLVLVDIPTLRKDFLISVSKKLSLTMEFIDCDKNTPFPTLPSCDVCIATEVFEHTHDPVRVFQNIDESLSIGGYFVANIGDHVEEYFHVSPDLTCLRAQVEARGYTNIAPSVFRKQERHAIH